MPIYNEGDRVIYQNHARQLHARNGQEAIVVDEGNHQGIVRIQFATPSQYGSYTHQASTYNLTLLTPLNPQEAILRTIRRLEKRQWFYQNIGKDLPAWSTLELVTKKCLTTS